MRTFAAPPRSGKSIFLAQNSRPMVPMVRTATPSGISPALDRIIRGEAGHNTRNLVPQAHEKPDFPIRQVYDVPQAQYMESAYPRHGSAHSLQYHSRVERTGAHMAPGAGRSSITLPPQALFIQQGAPHENIDAERQGEIILEASDVSGSPRRSVSPDRRVSSPPRSSVSGPLILVSGAPSRMSVREQPQVFVPVPCQPRMSLARRMSSLDAGMMLVPAQAGSVSDRRSLNLPRGSILVGGSLQVPPGGQHVVQRSASVPPQLQHAGPPRSGKSIFLAQGQRPMVQQSERVAFQATEATERIFRGEPAHPTLSRVASAPASVVWKRAGGAPSHQGPSAYPRSLQYHSAVERSGANQATGPGRGAVSPGAPPPQQFAPPPRRPAPAPEKRQMVLVMAPAAPLGRSSPRPQSGAAPPQLAAPPRSGKSIFLAQSARPMGAPRTMAPARLSPAMERIVRGESGYNPKDLPQSKAVAMAAARPMAEGPHLQRLGGAYPRHGSLHSLQYHSQVERSGAYQAPGAGRDSVFVPMTATQ